MPEPERLQPGRTTRPASGMPADASAGTFRQRWKRRRAAKKRRIRAMSRKRRIARRAGVFGTWVLGFVAAIMVTGIVLFYTLSDVPRPDTLPLPQVATILYSDGTVMARIGTVDRVIVQLNQVPEAGQVGRPGRRGPQLLQRAGRLDHRHAARRAQRPHRR